MECMRTEFSPFMTGESITMVVKFNNYGIPRFQGISCNINPITQKKVCLFFYEKEYIQPEPIEPPKLYTCVKPKRINGKEINHVDHVWICADLKKDNGEKLQPEDEFILKGHIYSYPRKGGGMDFGFDAYSLPQPYNEQDGNL